MTERANDTKVLNTLISTLLDSVEGYQKSAADVENQELARRFQDRARERQQAAASLQATVARLGGTPEDETSMLGSAHRMFMNLKEAVVGRDEQTILNEVDRGEDYLKGKFETALQSTDLSPEARSAVNEAWTSVKSGHDEMSQLKHTLQGYNQGVRDTTSGVSGQQQQQSYGGTTTGGTVGGTTSGGSFSGSDTAGDGQRTLTGTDTYQQQGGGYPGTIGSERGTPNV